MIRHASVAASTFGLFCLWSLTALGQTPGRVPYLGEEGQKAYITYQNLKPHRAFVISEGGGFGTGFDSATLDAAIQNATGPCKRRDPNGTCKPYALDGHVVWGMPEEPLRAAAIARVKASAAASGGRCAEPVGRDLPSGSPADLALSPQRLVQFNETLDAGKHDIRALLIVRDCRLLFERYKDGLSRDHNHAVYSVTKSVSATLAGILLHQGRLRSLDAPVASLVSKPFFISQDTWTKAERITFKNVMQMSTGLDYKHDPTGHPIYAVTVDRFAMALSPGLVADPGTRFNYSDGDASITGAVVASVADKNLYRFAREALFDSLQMANHDWPYPDSAGRNPGGWALRLRPMDMAKLGQLYLQKGEWNGQRLFAAEFVEQAWIPGSVSFYALHWWIGNAREANGTPYFYANGFKGQRVFVFPTLRLAVALSASLPPAEVRSVDALVVAAIVEAAASKSAVTPDALDALGKIQGRGFTGETRVAQSEQDRPRR